LNEALHHILILAFGFSIAGSFLVQHFSINALVDVPAIMIFVPSWQKPWTFRATIASHSMQTSGETGSTTTLCFCD